jgi:hypothetical protein
VLNLFEETQANAFLEELHHALGDIFESNNDVFHKNAPRVLDGMLKTHHVSMLRVVHELRLRARTRLFEFLAQHCGKSTFFNGSDEIQKIFGHLRSEFDLTCNPDALFVSSGEKRDLTRPWWHIDTGSADVNHLQGSVVLSNPHDGEKMYVYSRSHRHFDKLIIPPESIQAKFHMLTSEQIHTLEQNGCTPVSPNDHSPPGSLVLWFSRTVHHVSGNNFTHTSTIPRVISYVCFGKKQSLSDDELLKKTFAVLFGASCRHFPDVCDPTWQYGTKGLRRDLIEFNELSEKYPYLYGTRESDYETLDVYGLTKKEVSYVLTGIDDYINWESFHVIQSYLMRISKS